MTREINASYRNMMIMIIIIIIIRVEIIVCSRNFGRDKKCVGDRSLGRMDREKNGRKERKTR